MTRSTLFALTLLLGCNAEVSGDIHSHDNLYQTIDEQALTLETQSVLLDEQAIAIAALQENIATLQTSLSWDVRWPSNGVMMRRAKAPVLHP